MGRERERKGGREKKTRKSLDSLTDVKERKRGESMTQPMSESYVMCAKSWYVRGERALSDDDDDYEEEDVHKRVREGEK